MNEIDHADTDMLGSFSLEGFITRQGATSNFEPTIKIYHKCDDDAKKVHWFDSINCGINCTLYSHYTVKSGCSGSPPIVALFGCESGFDSI